MSSYKPIALLRHCPNSAIVLECCYTMYCLGEVGYLWGLELFYTVFYFLTIVFHQSTSCLVWR